MPFQGRKLKVIILSEVSETGKTGIIGYHFGGIKMDKNELFTKDKQPHRLRKESHGYQKRELRGSREQLAG